MTQPVPDYLDNSGPVIPTQQPNRKRAGLIAGGVLAGVLIAGGGAAAAQWYFSSGGQAAEALPANTLAYAQFNLDPSGQQKIEAVQMLRSFPGLAEEISADDSTDLRKTLWDKAMEGGSCDVSYDNDIAPWLGDRMAVAAVDQNGPQGVVVLEVSDPDAVSAAVDKLNACDEDATASVAFTEDWAVLGESQEVVDAVVADAESESLSDDADYQKWTDAAGTDGILTAYAAPAAYDAIQELLPTTPEAAEIADQFQGAALSVSFEDASLSIKGAGQTSNQDAAKALATSDGGDVISTLPADTAAALGLGLGDNWLQPLLDGFAPAIEPGSTGADLASDLETSLGVSVADLEATLGSSVAVVVPASIDPADPDSAEQIAVKFNGDSAKAQEVTRELGAQSGSRFYTATEGEVTAVALSQSAADAAVADGGLGDTDEFKRVVPDADGASFVAFVNFNSGPWFKEVAPQSPEVQENIDPLQALGMTSTVEDDGSSTFELRLTLD